MPTSWPALVLGPRLTDAIAQTLLLADASRKAHAGAAQAAEQLGDALRNLQAEIAIAEAGGDEESGEEEES